MDSEQTRGTVALHDQIADALRERIATGELGPGDLLPSVRALQDVWGCSTGPIRTALGLLKNEGRITTRQGGAARVRDLPERVAVSVSTDHAARQKAIALIDDDDERMAAGGAAEMALGMRLDSTDFAAEYDELEADADLANAFAVPVGTPLKKRSYRTTNKQTGALVLASDSYVPLDLIKANPALLDPANEPWAGGHWYQLRTVGVEIDRQSSAVTAFQPTTRQRQDWAVEDGVPFLRLRGRSFDIEGRVVEVADSIYPADRVEITFEATFDRWES